MSAKAIFKKLLSIGVRFLDSDKDGKLELSDLPGVVENLAELSVQGTALVTISREAFEGLKKLAGAGKLTVGGRVPSAEELDAKWDAGIAKYQLGGSEARALLAEPERES